MGCSQAINQEQRQQWEQKVFKGHLRKSFSRALLLAAEGEAPPMSHSWSPTSTPL